MQSDDKEQVYLQASHAFTRDIANAVNAALEAGIAPATIVGGLHLSAGELTSQILQMQAEARRRGAH